MREFWNRFTTSRYWFLGTLIVVGILILFFWSLIDRQGFVTKVQAFLDDTWEVIKYIIGLYIIYLAFCMILRVGPFRRRRGGGH